MQVYALKTEAPGLKFTPEGRYDHEASEKAMKDYYDDALKEVKGYGGGQLVGEIVRRPIADGCAEYMVGRVNGKTCLFWLQAGDAWQDSYFERTVTVAEIKDMVSRQKAHDALFSKASV